MKATPPSPVEPGYLTTEFWTAVAVQVIGLLTLMHVINLGNNTIDAIVGLIQLVLPQVFYALSRGIRKQNSD